MPNTDASAQNRGLRYVIGLELVALAVVLYFFTYSFAILASWFLLLWVILIIFGLFSSVFYKGIGERKLSLIVLLFCASILCLILLFANLYRWTGLKDTVKECTNNSLLDAIYFSTVTWTTLGYGDIVPRPESRFPAALEALLGYLVMALLTSALVSIFQTAQTHRSPNRPPLRLLKLILGGSIITIAGALVFTYGDFLLQGVVDHQCFKSSNPSLEQIKPGTSNVVIAPTLEAEIQRLTSVIADSFRDLHSSLSAAPIVASNLQGIEDALGKIDADLQKIKPQSVARPVTDAAPSQHIDHYPSPFLLSAFTPEQVVSLQAAHDALKGKHLTAKQRKAIVVREQSELNRHGADLKEDGIEGEYTKAALNHVAGLRM